ncbi:MAG: hypothetical protein ACI9W2_001634 [Gammaproteobacteria bacterium]|jgi:hypothetical protein
MTPYKRAAQLLTHEVLNMPPHQCRIRFACPVWGERWHGAYGALPVGTDTDAIVDRAG